MTGPAGISSQPRPMPFRFGVQCSSPTEVSASSWRALAHKVEDLGYSRLTVSDHLDEQLAPIAALMAAADATSTLRIGAMVLCNDYRHPVVLAKEAATLDVLSDGRFELGLGAGWMVADYQRAGIRLDPAGVRIERLEESIQLLELLFREEPTTFHGSHYTVEGLQGTPTPVQRPHPPILVGGGGKRILELAARRADIVGLNPIMSTGVIDASAGPDATAAATERKIGWIRAAAGERFDHLELQTRIHLVAVTDDRLGVATSLAPLFGLSPTDALESPHTLCGSVEQIAEDLVARRERFGLSAVGIGLDAVDALAPVVARLAGT
ncbi:MAG TPA: TIGR03621 family F420-dependent LLM class oxidoreductase [Acidimicrobiales bacterium]